MNVNRELRDAINALDDVVLDGKGMIFMINAGDIKGLAFMHPDYRPSLWVDGSWKVMVCKEETES